MSSDFFSQAVRSLLYQAPSLLVALAGIFVVIVNWRRAGAASVWAVIGFAILFGTGLLMPVLQTAVWQSASSRSMSMSSLANISAVIGIVGSLLHAATYVCLLIAVFAGRPAAAPSIPPMSVR